MCVCACVLRFYGNESRVDVKTPPASPSLFPLAGTTLLQPLFPAKLRPLVQNSRRQVFFAACARLSFALALSVSIRDNCAHHGNYFRLVALMRMQNDEKSVRSNIDQSLFPGGWICARAERLRFIIPHHLTLKYALASLLYYFVVSALNNLSECAVNQGHSQMASSAFFS